MIGRHDERQFVAKNFDGLEFRILRNVGDRSEIEAIIQDLARNVARKNSLHRDAHPGIGLMKLREKRQQSVDRTFVGAERELPDVEAFQSLQAFYQFVAQIQQALGIVLQELAGVGQLDLARAANHQWLAERILELAHGNANGGLGAEELFGGAGEASLLRDG